MKMEFSSQAVRKKLNFGLKSIKISGSNPVTPIDEESA